MPIRFRKSIKILPGVRLNLSKSGISVTLGGKAFSLNLGKQGTYANVDLPGSGLVYRTRLGGKKGDGTVQQDVTIGLNEDGTLHLTNEDGDELKEKDAAAFLKINKKEVVAWLEESCGRVNADTLALIQFHRTTPTPLPTGPAPDDPQVALTKQIETITWPRETNVSFEIENDTVLLDVDLPEIENMPDMQATVNKTALRLAFKARSQTQRRQEYQTHVHAVAFRLIGEIFTTLPDVRIVVLSAYSQRPDRRTGHVGDEYLLSVRVTRDQWAQLNFANLDAIDVVACFDLFEVRRKMSKSGDLSPIEPFTD